MTAKDSKRSRPDDQFDFSRAAAPAALFSKNGFHSTVSFLSSVRGMPTATSACFRPQRMCIPAIFWTIRSFRRGLILQSNGPAQSIAKNIAGDLNVVGLIAVEFFLTRDNELLVNELAPRPHNSGHYTFDACLTSQFEQQLRAVCGLPFGSPDLLRPVVMVNLARRPLESRHATRLAADSEPPLRQASFIRETGRSSWT